MKYYIKRIIKTIFVMHFKLHHRRVCVKCSNEALVYKCAVKAIKNQHNNQIVIGKGTKLYNCNFVLMGSNNTILIGENVVANGLTFWIEDDNNVISLGHNTTIGINSQLAACEGTLIVIGNDCMFSSNINIRTTDSHSIITKDGERVNDAKDVTIGNHCWLGMDVLVLKGTVLPDNCVVGARTILNAAYATPNSIYVGVLGKVIKSDVCWLRERI